MFALRRPLPLSTSALGCALITAGALLLAMGLRLALTPWLHDSQPVTLAVPLIAVVSIVCGVRWALLLAAAVLGWVALPWLPPDWPERASIAIAVQVVCTLVAAAIGWLYEPVPPHAGDRDRRTGSRRLRDTERALWMSAVLAVLVPVLLLAVFATSSRTAALDAATQRAEAALHIAGEHVSRIVQSNEVIARQVQAELERARPAPRGAAGPLLHPLLRRLAQGQPHVNSLWLIGADGFPVASSLAPGVPRIDYSDREYFVFHRANPGAVYVSRLLVTRSTQELFFDVSLRWEGGHDGNPAFLGVINVTLRPSYFVEFFRGIGEPQHALAVTLLRDDGFVLARTPQPLVIGARAEPPLLGALQGAMQGAMRGATQGTTTGDWLRAAPELGQYHDTVLRRLAPYPLVVAVSYDPQAVLQAQREQVAALGTLALLASFALVAALWIAWQRTLDDLRAIDRLALQTEQRRRAEDLLRQAQKVEALGQLTGSVAHDFNNLLGVLQNHLVLLDRSHPELAASGALPAMQRAVQSGEHLTRKLLAFSRRRALRAERIDLAQALPAMTELLRMTLGTHIAFHVRVEPDTPPIEADRAEVELALLNLAMNARAAVGGTGSVRLRARRDVLPGGSTTPAGHAPPAAAAVISLADDGAGMDEPTRSRAAEPFFSTKPEGQGTGLGLSQVERLCQDAGGALRIDSAPGAGTTVHLYFPAAAEGITGPRSLDPVRAEPVEALAPFTRLRS